MPFFSHPSSPTASREEELREELREQLQLFGAQLQREVLLPSLEDHRRQLQQELQREQRELLQPALQELRTLLKKDFGELLIHAPQPLAQPPAQASSVRTVHRWAMAEQSPRSAGREARPGAVKVSPEGPPRQPLGGGGGITSVKELEGQSDEEAPFLALQEAMTKREKMRACALRIVSHAYFDYLVCAVVVANAMLVGLEADWVARNAGADGHFFRVVDGLFCGAFLVELGIQVLAHRCELFTRARIGSTSLQVMLVVCQVLDVAMSFLHMSGPFVNVWLLQAMRLLRLVRVGRIIRIFNYVSELRTLLASIVGSLRTLLWVVLLYTILVYVAGTFFLQVVLETGFRERKGERHLQAFGSLGDTVLALWECVSGGMNWNTMAEPLFGSVSPLIGGFFLLYIFAAMALMNVVTGIFVDHAMRHAEEDQDLYVARNVMKTLEPGDMTSDGEITLSGWEKKLGCPEMQALFKSVGVDPSDGPGLFRLLDFNDSGTVAPSELVSAWVRLRGPAKSLDLALLMRETDEAHRSMEKSLSAIQDSLAILCTAVMHRAGEEVTNSPVRGSIEDRDSTRRLWEDRASTASFWDGSQSSTNYAPHRSSSGGEASMRAAGVRQSAEGPRNSRMRPLRRSVAPRR